jgi:thioesterase domain-containing protein
MGSEGEINSFVPDYTHAASPSFADLATRVLEQTREIQPNGPYAIGGYSLGGVLAYEIAGRLQAAGESVRYLAIVDAPTPKLARRSGRPTARVRRFLRHSRVERRMQIRRMVNRLPQPWRGQWQMAPPAYPLPSAERPDVVAGYQIRTLGENVPGYTSQGHNIALDLFTSDESVQHFGEGQLGWDEIHRGPLRRHPVTGDHASMWTEPNVGDLATLLIGQFMLSMSQAGSDRRS